MNGRRTDICLEHFICFVHKLISGQFNCCIIWMWSRHFTAPGGGLHSAHMHTGGQSKKSSCNPKISLHQLHCNPKISAHCKLKNLYMNIKYPETMQIRVRIASSEPRNFESIIFNVKKYHELNFIWTQKYQFWQSSNPKISSPFEHVLSAPLGLLLSF